MVSTEILNEKKPKRVRPNATRIINKKRAATQRKSLGIIRDDRREVIRTRDKEAVKRATELGLTLKRSDERRKKTGGTYRLQYGILDGRWRLGDYWPTTATLLIAGRTMKVASLMEAIEKVAEAKRTTKQM